MVHTVLREGRLIPFLARLTALGGSWHLCPGPVEWQVEDLAKTPHLRDLLQAIHPELMVRDEATCEGVADLDATVDAELDGERFTVTALTRPGRDWRQQRRLVAVTGRSRDAALALFHRIAEHRDGMPGRLRIWGGDVRQVTPEPVAEPDLVLPPDLKADLLGWLDRFWRLLPRAAELRLPLRRGVLLAGAPGTGKTMLVRHLLTRYPEIDAHLFVSAKRLVGADDPFGDMLARLRRASRPAMVILEDIDRITESGAVTKEGLLNCLDGLLALPAPTLWVATSNDPTLLERNLLDRPGRFDRVVVVPAPGATERRVLLERFSRIGIAATALDRGVTESEGLTPAHLKEACTAATLAALAEADETADYEALLAAELRRMREQHERARAYRFELDGERSAGFRRAG